jgi:hypothetical protein
LCDFRPRRVMPHTLILQRLRVIGMKEEQNRFER